MTAFKEAEVRPQITGIIQNRLYQEGSYVQADEVLFQIDPTTYQSAVNSAEAQLKKAIASEATNAKEVKRYAQLLKKKLTSQQNYDQAESVYLQAKAEVAIRQAELDYANIQLSYTKIKAPISGYAGFSLVSEGSLLTSGQANYITTIIQTDNVYVDMKQSSVALYKLKQEFMDLKTEKPTIPVTITLEDGSTYQHTGHLEFLDTQVDDSTGTVTLRAIIPNPENTLLAGMYVRAHIAMPEEREYLVIPQSSVIRGQSGSPSVYVVGEDNKALKKSVVLGNEVDNGWIVTKGLTAGDKVIINNFNNIKHNQLVIVDNQKSPTKNISSVSDKISSASTAADSATNSQDVD
ncbi:efflux RND transporter periplasmic adaptor subunit [Psychromonas algarum]|uniref:efflux RND transporter periplasmic adaptor subunit n=1 Tax=Psychromonas algarum TaxID=2555643 RepID=UPI001FBBC337|nr:efflux RND transporter periplasmic adaptor subunit [Psychromonas sp. RZ22]